MLGLEFVLLAALVTPGRDGEPKATVTVDSAHREIIVTAGPFSVKAMPAGMKHDAMDMMEGHETPVLRFAWPNASWLRGFKIDNVRQQLLIQTINRDVTEETSRATVIQKFRDRRERAEMRLELVLWNNEKDDEFHRRVVEGVELDPGCRSSKSRNYVIDAVG